MMVRMQGSSFRVYKQGIVSSHFAKSFFQGGVFKSWMFPEFQILSSDS